MPPAAAVEDQVGDQGESGVVVDEHGDLVLTVLGRLDAVEDTVGHVVEIDGGELVTDLPGDKRRQAGPPLGGVLAFGGGERLAEAGGDGLPVAAGLVGLAVGGGAGAGVVGVDLAERQLDSGPLSAAGSVSSAEGSAAGRLAVRGGRAEWWWVAGAAVPGRLLGRWRSTTASTTARADGDRRRAPTVRSLRAVTGGLRSWPGLASG